MKEYSLQEIFNLPEGTEFINADAHFEVMNGVLYSWFKPKDKQSVRLTKMYVNMKFIKVENSVSFIDVVNSNSRCRVDYYRIDELIEEESSYTWLKSYQDLDQIMSVLGEEFNTIAFKEILTKGKWFIQEESEGDE